jgi:hypothetical protein
MTLPDLKQLNKLIALCRKQGIKTIKMGELELTLSEEAPVKASRASRKAEPESVQGEIDAFDSLSDEEKLFWSVTGQTDESSEEGAS